MLKADLQRPRQPSQEYSNWIKRFHGIFYDGEEEEGEEGRGGDKREEGYENQTKSGMPQRPQSPSSLFPNQHVGGRVCINQLSQCKRGELMGREACIIILKKLLVAEYWGSCKC